MSTPIPTTLPAKSNYLVCRNSLLLLWLSHLLIDFCTGIWPIYKTIAGVDLIHAGLMVGSTSFCGEILQIVFGYFSDKGKRKTILLLGLFLSSLILMITFSGNLSHSFWLLLVLAIGSGAFHPAAMGFAGSISKLHKGKVILFFASGGALGLGISQLTFVHVLTLFDGHVWVLFIPFLIVITLVYFNRFPKQTLSENKISLRRFFEPLLKHKRSLSLLYCAQVANLGLFFSFTFLLPDLLRAKGCHSWLCMGGGHLCFILGSALIMVPAGILSDRFGQKKVLITVLSFALCLFYCFLLFPSLSFLLSALLLSVLGAFLGIINPILVSWGHRLAPEHPSTISGLLMGCAACFGGLGALLVGFLTHSFTEEPIVYAMGTMGLLMFLCLTLILFMPTISIRQESEIILEGPEKVEQEESP